MEWLFYTGGREKIRSQRGADMMSHSSIFSQIAYLVFKPKGEENWSISVPSLFSVSAIPVAANFSSSYRLHRDNTYRRQLRAYGLVWSGIHRRPLRYDGSFFGLSTPYKESLGSEYKATSAEACLEVAARRVPNSANGVNANPYGSFSQGQRPPRPCSSANFLEERATIVKYLEGDSLERQFPHGPDDIPRVGYIQTWIV
ncbi:hypothetical protein PM082_010407 [Marasmius tenuissimus]|nr:hypothetical protein PM082_010407 [Marasmius tenuissimus]